MKKITLLGSTGSIGTQTLDVIRQNRDKFEVVAISANRSVDLLLEQIIEFKPKYAVLYEKEKHCRSKFVIVAFIKPYEYYKRMLFMFFITFDKPVININSFRCM